MFDEVSRVTHCVVPVLGITWNYYSFLPYEIYVKSAGHGSERLINIDASIPQFSITFHVVHPFVMHFVLTSDMINTRISILCSVAVIAVSCSEGT